LSERGEDEATSRLGDGATERLEGDRIGCHSLASLYPSAVDLGQASSIELVHPLASLKLHA
jgi:hypothetical protein